tara:strand:- start:65 stop:211 length:147 start_codon:yes stop_codon:yes gene_type:complete
MAIEIAVLSPPSGSMVPSTELVHLITSIGCAVAGILSKICLRCIGIYL